MTRGEARETEQTHEAIVIGVGQRAAFGSSAAAAPHTEVQAGRRGAADEGRGCQDCRGDVAAGGDGGVHRNTVFITKSRTLTQAVRRNFEETLRPVLGLGHELDQPALTMTQHGWDTLYAEYKESGE